MLQSACPGGKSACEVLPGIEHEDDMRAGAAASGK
jgi:hypothetical protein